MEIPETHYAKTPDGLHIAYQVVGDGPIDLVMFPGLILCVDPIWQYPPAARFLQRLASFTRLILFDPRGWGASDAGPVVPILEGWVEDMAAVMDAVGSEQAALFGFSLASPLPIMFAASRPERTLSVVLVEAFARMLRDDDYPCGMPDSMGRWLVENLEREWGTGASNATSCPSKAEDESFRRWVGLCERVSCPPNRIGQTTQDWLARDVRQILSAVRVPTLVLHRRDDPFIRVGNGRYLGEHIPDAKYIELPGEDHFFCVGDQDVILDEIEEFITGTPPVHEPDRALATVLFTDFVASTEHAARLGDRKWTQVLDQHDALVSRELDRHRGRKINTRGDGVLATFDGPARAVRCAQAICEGMRALGVEVRSGLHTGEVELRGDDVAGVAVHIAARVMAQAGPGEVVVSSTVKDLVAGSGIVFSDRGTHTLKGVPDEWRLFAVES